DLPLDQERATVGQIGSPSTASVLPVSDGSGHERLEGRFPHWILITHPIVKRLDAVRCPPTAFIPFGHIAALCLLVDRSARRLYAFVGREIKSTRRHTVDVDWIKKLLNVLKKSWVFDNLVAAFKARCHSLINCNVTDAAVKRLASAFEAMMTRDP